MVASRLAQILVLLFAAAHGVVAQVSATTDQSCGCPQWIDAKTGKPVPTVPLSGVNLGGVTVNGAGAATLQDDDPKSNQAYNPKTGQNFVRLPNGCWIDAKTGKPVPTAPLSGVNLGGVTVSGAGAATLQDDDPKSNQAYNPKTGQNFVRVPCPPPTPSNTNPPAPPPSTVSNPTLQAPTAAPCYRWIDKDTGTPVPTGPAGWSPSAPDPGHFASGGHAYAKSADGTWTDAATGNPVPTGPPGWNPGGDLHNPDRNHVFDEGHTYIRVRCPEPTGALPRAARPVARPKQPELHPSNTVAPTVTPKCDVNAWTGSYTHQRLADIPYGSVYTLHLEDRPGEHRDPGAPLFSWDDHAINLTTKETDVRLPSGVWINAISGDCVPTYPLDAIYTPLMGVAGMVDVRLGWINNDPDHAYNLITGESFIHHPWPVSTAPPLGSVGFQPGPPGPVHSQPLVPVVHGKEELTPIEGLILNDGFFAPPGYCWGWVDDDTGDVAVTTHHPFHLDRFNLNPDSLTFDGHTYLNLTAFGDDEDYWVDAATGDRVDDPLGEDDDDDDEDIYIDGHHFVHVLVPCDEHNSTNNLPGPGASIDPRLLEHATVLKNPATYTGIDWGVGGSIGITGHTTTYDDDYKIGGPGFFGRGFGFITDGIDKDKNGTSRGYLSLILGATAPTNTSSREDAESHLKFVGTVTGEIGFNVGKLPDGSPFTIFVNGGPAFGVESAGASFTIGTTDYSYTDTEKMFGFTTGGGVGTPLSKRLDIFAEVDYLHFNQTSFASPSGDYKLRETAIIGSVGVAWSFHKQPKK